MKKVYFIISLILLSSGMLMAQVVSSFSCDFENQAQNAEWSLINGTMAASIPNQWYIGNAINNGGKYSLYISDSGGATATYSKFSAYTVAYTDITLRAGTYDLSFDWCAMGNADKEDGLYVCWVPDREWGDSILLNSNTSTTLSSDLQSHALSYTNFISKKLAGSATWKNAFTTITSDGTHYRLAFIWLTSNGMDAANPGACIDNIAIIDNNICPKPTDIQVTVERGQRVRVSWSGNALQYEVRCYSYVSKEWQTVMVADTTAVFANLAEGACDFYVSAICGDDMQSITSVYSNYFFYIPQNHCIDYLTLDSTNCFIANEHVGSSTPVCALTWQHKKVDYNYQSRGSRHTIHMSPTETDPRTCGRLKTVPEGEIASVRLGNWNTGSEAERIEFKVSVDASVNPVLLLKYAVVLQKPNDGCKPNPGFLMRILDKNGQLVSKCASADFDFRSAQDAEWEVCFPENTNDEVRWKDWTTVGVDLADFDGDTLTVQLTTYDCGGGGHYGYAYFTLGCSDGQLTGMSCGVENTTFTAPVGFNYRWYNVQKPTEIISREQALQVESQDTCHYRVDLMFEQDSTCFFSLTASAQPYQPSAQATYTWTPANCMNVVQFKDLSHIKETNQITNEVSHTNRPVDFVIWDFGDGSVSYEQTPAHIFPDTGGTFDVGLTAYLSTCTDTLRLKVTVPSLGTKRDTLAVNRCAGTTYKHTYTDTLGTQQTVTLDSAGFHSFLSRTYTGCDSITTVALTFTDSVVTHIDTLIMKGETCTVGGKEYSQSGTYSVRLLSSAGCDSIVILNLTVYDYLRVEADTAYIACEGDSDFMFLYKVVQGSARRYSLRMQDPAFPAVDSASLLHPDRIEIALPDLRPDNYFGNVIFIDSIGGDVTIPFRLELRYSSSVIAQRWNDVLALRNAQYNGGYEWVAYQWFKNGEPIAGETNSYYYAPRGLDMNAEYSALVTRVGDGFPLQTCTVIPQPVAADNVPDIPTLVERGQPVSYLNARSIPAHATARWTNICGTTVAEQHITAGHGLTAPDMEGIYILSVHNEDGSSAVYTVVVL